MTNYQLPSISAQDAIAALRTQNPPALIDMRKAPARGKIGISGAQWIDPMQFGHDQARGLSGQQLLVFCVHGHEVSQFGCALARIHSAQAQYVIGGFEALLAAGALVEDLA